MKEQKPRSKKKILIAALAAVMALTVILGSTFLWFTASHEVENVFNMDGFDVRITEKFEPEPVVPGTNIDKLVGVENKGTVDVAVRVKLKETLQLLELDGKDSPLIIYNDNKDLGPNEIIVTVSPHQIAGYLGSGYAEITPAGKPDDVTLLARETKTVNGTKTEYVAYLNDGSNRLVEYTPADPGATPPVVESYKYAAYKKGQLLDNNYYHGTGNDLPAPHHDVIEIVMGSNKWLLRPTATNDGWYYYDQLVAPGSLTDYIVTEVKFSQNMGNMYKGAVYTLTPTLEAVQGVQEAVNAEWGDVITINADKSISLK